VFWQTDRCLLREPGRQIFRMDAGPICWQR
jgi:hypothetical protein